MDVDLVDDFSENFSENFNINHIIKILNITPLTFDPIGKFIYLS
jgi:hypothetical protein